MKIRNGFVSNSSSSSFVVIFPRIPTSVEDVEEMVFKEEKYYYDPFDDNKWTSQQVSETIWKDICDQKPNDFEGAKDIIMSGSFEDGPEYDDNIKDYKERWKKYDRDIKKYAEKKFNDFFNVRKLKLKKINGEDIQYDGGVFYIFEYSDNSGDYFCALEHGNLFHKLKHIKVSNH